MKNYSQAIFDKNTIEFVTVAAEFCGFLERAGNMKQSDFVTITLKLLSLLYLKASMLPEVEPFSEEAPEHDVTEETYEALRINIAAILADKDDYLEVFLPDMAYSDTPIKQTISENLADIYQDIRDFIFVFRQGFNETMNDALYTCQENFSVHWGQKLVNTLRALHDVKYNSDAKDQDDAY
jgi:type I restriction-modification system DNA methylase subunit